MRFHYLLFLFVFISVKINAQNIPDWENPEVFAINKEKTRTSAIPYPSERMALDNNYSSSPYYKLLDGEWKFKWVPKVAEISPGFYEENFDINKWGKISVPGNWEFNGYGVPIYVNTGFGFKAKPPFIDRKDSPVGMYRREFDIPEGWNGRKVFIHFEAGTNAMYVWVNGEKVGYTQNSKSPAEFDITPYIRKGKNTLACEVHKYSDGSYLEDQDMWRLGGINRSVFLYSTDQTRILDFFAHPDLDKNYRNGLFSIDVKLMNYGGTEKKQTVEVSVFDKNEKKIFGRQQQNIILGTDTAVIQFSGKISNPLKWTAETPNLYNMVITLKDNGKVIESTSHKIGFRKIEIKDGQLYVNGKKIYIKGVNLHEFNTNMGNVVNEQIMMRNLQLMKELNINAVRTSHYPQDPLWYKLCDKYGIYLVDEANLESHGLGYGSNNVSNFPEWHAQHMDRIIRLIERDKNHASVIFWSLGNEASNGKAFFDMYGWAKRRDPSRPVQYEQAGRQRNSDIICPMYPWWGGMQEDARKDLGKPYIMCEYAHAMGNSMGNFQEYWDLIRTSKNMQGGFIWEWYNHGYPAKDEQGRFYWAYGGDLGGYDKMNNDNFCMDGIISPDQQYIPHTRIVKKVYQNILFEAKDLRNGIITVVNDFKFSALTPEEYSYKWVLLENGRSIKSGTFDVVIVADSRKDIKLDIGDFKSEPGKEHYLQIFAYNKKKTDLLPAEFEVAREEFAMPTNNYFAKKPMPISSPLEINKSENRIVVKSKNIEYEFATTYGKSLLNITKKGKGVFSELPKLNFWRAPTDNDFGAGEHYGARIWEAASYNQKTIYKGIDETNGSITFNYEIKLRGIEAKVDLSYTVNIDGSLTINSHYKSLGDDLPEMMRFGMIMSLPKTFDDFTWYGRGPYENYIDRNHDTFMGEWNGKIEDQVFHYYRPQETGNKTDVRWFTLQNKEGKGILITGSQPLSVNASNYKPEDLDPGSTKKQQHWSDVSPRSETVLCVDLFQKGIAGLDSWGAQPLDQYRFKDKEYAYSYTIQIKD